MNSDRDGIRGGWATPGDDQPDAESGIEMTGEFTIDYAPPAWYTQNAAGAPGTSGTPDAPGAPGDASEQPGPPAPPVGPPAAVPHLPPAWTAQPVPPAPPAPPAPPVPTAASAAASADAEEGSEGALVSAATMRISSAALKRQIAERGGSVEGEAEAGTETRAESAPGSGSGEGGAAAAGEEAGAEAPEGSEASGVAASTAPGVEPEAGEQDPAAGSAGAPGDDGEAAHDGHVPAEGAVGDVDGRPAVDGVVNLSKGLFLNVYPTEWLGFRLALNHGVLEGYDSTIKGKGGDEEFRKARNLGFKSSVFEGYAALELSPTVFLEKYDGLLGKLRPYGLVGVGVFHFNPKAIYYAPDGSAKWVELHPLRLEGQGFAEYPDRKPYSLTQLEIPMGVGVKYYIKENMFIGMEVLHRQTFTDYVDDVSKTYIDPSLFSKYLTPQQTAMALQLNNRQNFSPSNPTRVGFGPDPQRGDPTQNDAFFSTIIRMGWRLNTMSSELRQLRCPSFY